jgi:hypothetical protein
MTLDMGSSGRKDSTCGFIGSRLDNYMTKVNKDQTEPFISKLSYFDKTHISSNAQHSLINILDNAGMFKTDNLAGLNLQLRACMLIWKPSQRPLRDLPS